MGNGQPYFTRLVVRDEHRETFARTNKKPLQHKIAFNDEIYFFYSTYPSFSLGISRAWQKNKIQFKIMIFLRKKERNDKKLLILYKIQDTSTFKV